MSHNLKKIGQGLCAAATLGVSTVAALWDKIGEKYNSGALITLCVILVIGGLLVYCDGERQKKEEAGLTKKETVTDQSVNIGRDNNGTIAPIYDNRVSINSPEIECIGTPEKTVNADGSATFRFSLRVTSPANGLRVQAQGEALRSLAIMKPLETRGASGALKQNTKRWPGTKSLNEQFEGASGYYDIVITTNDGAQPGVFATVDDLIS
ncbi:hypothetical protein G8E10_17815 [Rhizobiaceae bacterium CRRU44]|uniref:Uncharacterized protein n=1 Tax=Ferranicluibacter rubi TaxID=2715133 RepID=A0AA43ZGQ5_9HYPH|nr:hypothetical protein [Ferranicluibacter rubi]NHT77574.1 hypothetical protein [Ferranicluibacter rubi]